MLRQPLLLLISIRVTLRRNLLHVRHCRNLFANFPWIRTRSKDTLTPEHEEGCNLFLGSDLEGKGRSDPDLGMPAGWVTDAPTLALPLLLLAAASL